ncbi:hypothetical protein Tco_0827169 [Tanacetum coccineum]
MPPPPIPSLSTSNTMPPPSGSNTMPPPPIPSSSNTMPALNTSACSNTMPSHATSASTGTNKGKCPLIPKNRGRPAKSSASSSRGGSRGGARGGSSKRGRGSNTIPFQGLRDEASDEEIEQRVIVEDDQFWEECAREFDHVKEHRAQDKDESLQGGADLPTKESTLEVNPKPIRSKKSKAAEVPNQMRIFHKNRGRSKRIFNQKMKISSLMSMELWGWCGRCGRTTLSELGVEVV